MSAGDISSRSRRSPLLCTGYAAFDAWKAFAAAAAAAGGGGGGQGRSSG